MLLLGLYVGRTRILHEITSHLPLIHKVFRYGFGQLFLLGPAATTDYATLFFVILLIFCNWLLGKFRFGPVEWLWRSLTYLQPQPLRLCLNYVWMTE